MATAVYRESSMHTPVVLYPCPPKKNCGVCEARLNQVFGSADKSAKYRHQAGEAGVKVTRLLYSGGSPDEIVALAMRAASFANRILILLALLLGGVSISACSFEKGGSVLSPSSVEGSGSGGTVSVQLAAALATGDGPFVGHVVSKPGHGESGDLEVTFLEEGPNYRATLKFIGRLEIVTGTLQGSLDNMSIVPDANQTPTGTRCNYHAFNGKWSQAVKDGQLYDVIVIQVQGLGPDPCSSKEAEATVWRLAKVPALSVSCAIGTGRVGVPYAGSLTVTGGVAPFTYSVTAGALPTGLTLNASTGAIAGTPTAAGTFPYTATVVDQRGTVGTASAICGITVDPPPCVGGDHLPFPLDAYIASFPPNYPDPFLPTSVGPFPFTIPAGTWHLTAVTGDNHSTKQDGTQLHEQGHFVTDTGISTIDTTDVADDQDAQGTDLGVITFPATVHAISFVHINIPVTEPTDSVRPIVLTYSCPASTALAVRR